MTDIQTEHDVHTLHTVINDLFLDYAHPVGHCTLIENRKAVEAALKAAGITLAEIAGVGLGVAATIFIIWMLRRHGHQTQFAWALSLILGGAVGNIVDRLLHGFVFDFIALGFIFLALLAVLFLKERVGWRRWTGIAVGFVGVLLVIQPRPGTGCRRPSA